MLFKMIVCDSMTTGRCLIKPFFVQNMQVSYYTLKQEKQNSGFYLVQEQPANNVKYYFYIYLQASQRPIATAAMESQIKYTAPHAAV